MKFYIIKEIKVRLSSDGIGIRKWKMTRRSNHPEDPWVTVGDIYKRDTGYLYAGNKRRDKIDLVKDHHGAYVFIKKGDFNNDIQFLLLSQYSDRASWRKKRGNT